MIRIPEQGDEAALMGIDRVFVEASLYIKSLFEKLRLKVIREIRGAKLVNYHMERVKMTCS